jgi:hypothetical protein
MGRRPSGRIRKGRWMAQLGPVDPQTGRRRDITLRHPDGRPILAAERKAAAQAIRRLSSEGAGSGLTVARLLGLYMRWQAETGASQRTLDDLDAHLIRWARLPAGAGTVGDLLVSEARPEHAWQLRASGAGGLRNAYAAIKAAFRWAHRPIEGRTPAVLCTGGPHPLESLKVGSGGRRSVAIDPADARRLRRLAWAHARQPTKTRRDATKRDRRRRWLALAAQIGAGLRTHEAVGLTWGEVRQHGAEVPSQGREVPSQGREVPSQGVELVLAIDPARDKRRRKGVAPDRPAFYGWSGPAPRRWLALAAALARPEPTLAGCSGQSYSRWFSGDVVPYAAAHGLALPPKFSPYAARHAHFNRGKRSGMTAEELSGSSGNSPEVLRRVYLHGGEEDALKVARKMRG